MPEIEVTVVGSVDIELYCEKCGEGICANGTATLTRGHPCFRIDPCEKCLSTERNIGYEEGYQTGYAEAEDKF